MEEEQKKLKNINGTLILFHENVYLLSSPKYKHDVMLMMHLSSCLQKEKHKNYGPRCKSSRQFFFLLPLLPHFFLYRTLIYLHF